MITYKSVINYCTVLVFAIIEYVGFLAYRTAWELSSFELWTWGAITAVLILLSLRIIVFNNSDNLLMWFGQFLLVIPIVTGKLPHFFIISEVMFLVGYIYEGWKKIKPSFRKSKSKSLRGKD